MARALNFTNPLFKVGEYEPATKVAMAAIEARRLLLAEKVFSNQPRPLPNTIKDHFGKERKELEERVTGLTPAYSEKVSVPTIQIENPIEESISIIDLDSNGPDKGYRVITLPFIPRELNWNSDSNFVAIKPIGRNNPKFHYTGSEDNLEFEIDWHSFDNNRDDVIRNCRIIEALSKGDAYNNPPHRVLLKWGSEDVLFKDMVFLVTSAPYKLTHFNKAQFLNNRLQKTAMLPKQAIQKVTLARITSNNLSSKDIELVKSTKYY
jgi:hypothetical protein